MTDSERPNPFARLDKFKPKDANDEALALDIGSISSASNWPSREPAYSSSTRDRKPFRASTEPPKVQFNIRVDSEDKERFYRIAEVKNITKLGILFKQCLDALEQSEK